MHQKDAKAFSEILYTHLSPLTYREVRVRIEHNIP